MKDRFRHLAQQATVIHEHGWGANYEQFDKEKFAELIIQDVINLLRQEWYDLNNQPDVANESPRDVGLRVGKKGEIITLMEKIKKHYGVNEC